MNEKVSRLVKGEESEEETKEADHKYGEDVERDSLLIAQKSLKLG